jgi:arabinan endo-1,5-alpha-L-arabinosidase
VITDDAGTDWILYHGVDNRRPRSKPSDDVNTRRVMLLDRLIWRDGWPEIASKSPTDSLQRGPLVRR